MGLEGATEALRWGVNDLGGTLMEENISRMAGSQHGVRLSPEQLIAAARAAGREPAQRTTLYEIIETYAGDGPRAARQPLRPAELPEPEPGPGQVLIEVRACGVCRTDLHILDGELAEPKLPLVPGHQIVGTVRAAGEGAERFAPGERVGVPWLGWTDGECRYCRSGRENLCDHARFTGYDLDGGYAELTVADERFCFPIPAGYPDEQAAPLLCAGLIGYRALRLVGEAERIGFYGFGASAHILCQVAVHEGPARLRLHPRGRRRDAGVRPRARRRVGGRLGGGAAGGARRRDRLRRRRRADAGGAAGQRQGRAGDQRRHPHERHPLLPLRRSSGRSARSARSPT